MRHSTTLPKIASLLLVLIVVLIGRSVPEALHAQSSQRGFNVAAPLGDAEREAAGFSPWESAGVFVGVREFKKDARFSEVLYAVDDAVDLAHLFSLELRLIDPRNVVLALSGEPSKEETRERLRQLLVDGARRTPATQADIYDHLDRQGKMAGPKGLFVVSMSTHGFTDPEGDYLLGSDSLARVLKGTGVATAEVFDLVSEARAPRRLVLIDACRERQSSTRGTATRGVPGGGELSSAMSKSFVDAVSKASGQVVLFGATRNGFAYDDFERGNGVFVSAVIDGLRGQALSDRRSFITAATLSQYVHQRVVDWVGTHRPEHAELSRGISARLEGGAADLPLAVSAKNYDYIERRAVALKRLHKNIRKPDDTENPITGTTYDKISDILHTDHPGSEELHLLDEVEKLDGTLLTQRNLDWFVGKYFRDYTPRQDRWKLPEYPAAEPAKPGRGKKKADAMPPVRTEPRLGDVWTEELTKLRFAYLPPGRFTMGSPVSEVGRDKKETMHPVTLSRGFWMATTEVTQMQFALFVAETGYETEAERNGRSHVLENGAWVEKAGIDWRRHNRGNLERPVVHVSWNDAQAFCQWLSRRTGKQVRLPTEAEWEYAARAGSTTATFAGDFTVRGNCEAPELDDVAWHCGNSHMTTRPVGQKKPNAWKLHDMLGNASEWVADRIGYFSSEPATDPQGPEHGEARVWRGGSVMFAVRGNRAAARHAVDASKSFAYLGFRVVVASSK